MLVFIPTAANIGAGDKEWLINDLYNCNCLDLKKIDIVDISAIEKKFWLPRIEAADILFFGGGNTNHLMFWLEKSGLKEVLPELLKTRVYAGISAGSIVATPSLALSSEDKKVYYEKVFGYKVEKSLDFVDFHIRPHFNSPYFPHANDEYIKEVAKKIGEPIYAIDDQSAIKVVDGKIEVVSEGKYLTYNLEIK